MTIISAISRTLKEIGRPATYNEIHQYIVDNNYFKFGAKSPVSVVRVKLRLHSVNVDIKSGYGKEKFFRSEGGSGVDEKFSLLEAPIRINNKEVKKSNKGINNASVIKDDSIYDSVKKWYKKLDFSIHKSACIECFWMLCGSFLPILIDSFLRKSLLNIGFFDAVKQNLKSGEVFLLTSALIMPFFFILINYMRSDDEHKRVNKLPYFGWMFFLTIVSLLSGIFTFVYYRIGQLVWKKAESEVVKAMFGFDFSNWAMFIFIISLFVWYYSSYMNHRTTDTFKKIRSKQQKELENKFNAVHDQQVI
ncbi:hypothetical protein [uncultured Photobacterium sp.]|uniref:hypothetical protein n=1 Tax=uncultured Photobacterium sp. TaxID=173973 RepID=UPI002609F91C|nr:hypothetical protein [uncultured Photobacterium sp.]